MSATAALVLYPTWAIAVLVAATSLRMGRAHGRGLVALCFLLAAWVAALALYSMPETRALGERAIPSGMLLAGGFLHAGRDLLGERTRAPLVAGYGFGAATGIVGALAPAWLYRPGLAAPGPLFWPLALVSLVGAVLVMGWLVRETRRAPATRRPRLRALALGNALALVAGGGAVSAQLLGWIDDLVVTAPLLLGAVLLIGWAVLASELGRARRLLAQALVYALLTAALSAGGLLVLFALLPWLVPAGGPGWTLFVLFFAALPLDALRVLVVERLGRHLFARPTGARDLADELERSETRAEHAERLAEIGTITSAVAHEIRNPLGVIAAQAKLLERAGASPASVAALRAQVERARRFLDDLLRYGRPRPLELAEVELAPLVESAAAAAQGGLGGTAASLVLDVPRLAVVADRAALGDVVIVLVQNALIAAGERDGRAGRVAVRARADDGVAEIVVEDDGPGVPSEVEDRLFEPFVTGRGRDHRHPGTGLGLAIAARWIARHGGTLRHERPAEGGARFVVRWPQGGAGDAA